MLDKNIDLEEDEMDSCTDMPELNKEYELQRIDLLIKTIRDNDDRVRFLEFNNQDLNDDSGSGINDDEIKELEEETLDCINQIKKMEKK